MKAIYGKKVGMTRVFTAAGESVPVTVLEIEPNVIFQVKSKDSDGYDAVQVGIDSQKTQRVNKPLLAHMAKAEKGAKKMIAEIRLNKKNGYNGEEYAIGAEITLEGMFEVGARVDVSGISVGKGFAGVMKRHNMAGFSRTHGTHEYFRHGGSIGNRKFPGRVFKNKRMPGHMGVENVTQLGLEVVSIKAEQNLLLVKGSVPGPKNGYVFVRQAVRDLAV